jgi:two-component system NtrC family sensor kinase
VIEPHGASGARGQGKSALGAQRRSLAAWMVVAIAIVTALAWWDERREADAALQDLEAEQTVVASSLAASLRAHLVAVERDAQLAGEAGEAVERGVAHLAYPGDRYVPAAVRDAGAAAPTEIDPSRILIAVPLAGGRRVDLGVRVRDLLDPDPQIERAGELTVLLATPQDGALRATTGARVESPPLSDALARDLPAQRLGRPEAAQIGLPARTAMAGLARVDALGRWGVVVVASAARERDREKRAVWRLVLGVFMASGLVLVFGGLALRNQRKELDLARDLAMAQVQRSGDEALARGARIATMGTFAMGIAHEMSTPLGVIVGRSEQLLGRVQGDERAVRGAQIILQQADRIRAIIRRFLDMARGGPPSLERADPAEVARAAASAVEHRFAEAGVSLASDIPPAMPAVQCDRALLEHAIVNLLLNACEACRPGEHVEVAARSGSDRVAFVVTDDGAGITREDAARAKQPFFTTKGPDQGSGLGLAIATEIAHSHRGELSIEPGAGGGTRACIEIPVAAPRDSDAGVD